jgi:hypothetical protein
MDNFGSTGRPVLLGERATKKVTAQKYTDLGVFYNLLLPFDAKLTT